MQTVQPGISDDVRCPLLQPAGTMAIKPSSGRSRRIETTHPPEVRWHFAYSLPCTWAGSSAIGRCCPVTGTPFGAIALDDRHHWGHIALGYWAMMSIAAIGRAVSLNPNSAAALSHLSRGFVFAATARRLSGPLDPEMALFLAAIAVAHCAAGRYGQAIERSLEAQRLRPGFQGSSRPCR